MPAGSCKQAILLLEGLSYFNLHCYDVDERHNLLLLLCVGFWLVSTLHFCKFSVKLMASVNFV